MLKTIGLTEPVVSGQEFGKILGQMVMQLSGGSVIMQRVGDFRLGQRSTKESFNDDLYDFKPTLSNAVAADLSLSMPAKILRDIWSALKKLDSIVPGVLHPSTILYYPEIKTYSNKPKFLNKNFINATLLKKIDSNVLIYTIDETTDFLKFSKLDIDGIMTNDIRFFSKLIKGYDE